MKIGDSVEYRVGRKKRRARVIAGVDFNYVQLQDAESGRMAWIHQQDIWHPAESTAEKRGQHEGEGSENR